MDMYYIVLGGGQLQLPLVHELRKRSYRVSVVDQNPDAVARQYSHDFIPLSTSDKQSILAILEDKPYKTQIQHILTCGTDMMQTVAWLSGQLGLPSISQQQSIVTSNKSQMRDLLQKNNFIQPSYCVSSDKNTLHEWLNQQDETQSHVIKPVDNMGARGVIFLRDKTDLSFAFELSQIESKSQTVIIEQYIHGREISVDALVYDGQCYITGIADRIIRRKDGMYFIELGHNMPSKFDKDVITQIHKCMQNFSDCLGMIEDKPYHGALKADLKYTRNKKILINEIASRLSGGFMSTHTFFLSTQVDLIALYVDLITRHPDFINKIQNIRHNQIAIERSIITAGGRLDEITMPEDLSHANASIEHTAINYKVSDLILPIKNNVGKLAHIIIQGKNLQTAEKLFQSFCKQLIIKVSYPVFDDKTLRKQSKAKFNPQFCWVCKICDGINCASRVPGMGALGRMESFQNNLIALKNIHLVPKYIDMKQTNCDIAKRISVKTSILGIPTNAPIMTAPITGSITNMGGSITEWEYAFETGTASKKLGLIPMFGDGATEDKFLIGLKAIRKLGSGFPVFKPRSDLKLLEDRIQIAYAHGVSAWGMDIDALSFQTMIQKKQFSTRKSVELLQRLSMVAPIPFFIKGVMSVEDAKLSCQAGASAIIISNHGGRVLDSMPGTAMVLPMITQYVRKHFPDVEILADGGIRSGIDVFKMLSLGADAVLIGRPVAIATIAFQRFGTYHVLRQYIQELEHTMSIYGFTCLKDIKKQKNYL